jgi:CRISPR-associated protein Cas2
MALSKYNTVWLFAMFDLPVNSEEARRRYARFRKLLLEHGFSMLQYSVYARCFPSEEASDAVRRRVRSALPTHGQVRLLAVTDCQFGKMEVYEGKSRQETENATDQLLLF